MLDRQRLLKISALADEVLRTQDELVNLDRAQNGRREALGAFRRGEACCGSHWMAMEGQFLRLQAAVGKDWLQQQQEETKSEISKTRALLKDQTQALLREHPEATELS